MSKNLKNNRSEGDGEFRSVQKRSIHPRSFSCKPDIGPSGDHQSSDRKSSEYLYLKPKIRVAGWMDNRKASGSSENSCNNEMYRLNENHIEKINSIRRRLNLVEILDAEERDRRSEHSFYTEDGIIEVPSDFSENLSRGTSKSSSEREGNWEEKRCTSQIQNESRTSEIFGTKKSILSVISESSQNSIGSSNYSQLKYKPPIKKMCLRVRTPNVASTSPVVSNFVATHSKVKVPNLNLDTEDTSESVENKSVQCASMDTGKASSRTNTGTFNEKNTFVNQHLEPEVIIRYGSDSSKVSLSENCVKFLPIKDEEVKDDRNGTSENRETFDDILSGSGVPFEKITPAIVPSYDTFFKSKPARQQKKRFTKKGRTVLKSAPLDTPNVHSFTSITPCRSSEPPDEYHDSMFTKTCEDDTIANISNISTSLAVPKLSTNSMKFPAITKLSQFIQDVTDKETPSMFDVETTQIKPKMCGSKPPQKYARVSHECSKYKEAAEKLLRTTALNIIESDSDQTGDCLKKNWIPEKNSNKYYNRKQQSVDYNFYSADLSPGRTNDIININQVSEHESDSECLKMIENCCCIKKIFKRRKPRYFTSLN